MRINDLLLTCPPLLQKNDRLFSSYFSSVIRSILSRVSISNLLITETLSIDAKCFPDILLSAFSDKNQHLKMCKTVDSYSGGTQFEPQSSYLIHWGKFPWVFQSVTWMQSNIRDHYKWCERFLPTNLCNRSHHL